MTEEVKKSAGFAFPGDVSFTLNMTRPSLRRSNATVAIPKIGVWAKIYRHSEAKPKPPRQVAPSPPRYACHLSRFNGRAYSRKGGFPRGRYTKQRAEMQEKILHFGSLTIGLKLKINRVAFRSYAFADCGDG